MSEIAKSTKPTLLKLAFYCRAELLILATCLAFSTQVGRSTAPVYDPVGPDQLPIILIALVSVLTLAEIVRKVMAGDFDEVTVINEDKRKGAAVLFALVTIAYVAVLSMTPVPYFLTTAGYFVLSSTIIAGRAGWKELAVICVIGLAFGYGLQTIFTEFFVIDLPR